MRKISFAFLAASCLSLALLLTACQTRRVGLIVPCPNMSEMARTQFEDACGADLDGCPMTQIWVQELARYCLMRDQV